MSNKSPLLIYIIPIVFLCIFASIIWRTFASAMNTEIDDSWYGVNQNFVKLLTDKIEDDIKKSVKDIQKNYEKNFDLDSDSSLQKYIEWNDPLKPNYEPLDLEKIESEFVSFSSKNDFYLRMSARVAFQKLAEEFFYNFHKKLYLVSAYRSYKYQLELIKNGCSLQICAEPWFSEHQLGVAVDIHIDWWNWTIINMEKNSEYYNWLLQNAYKFGFQNTYQKWFKIDKKMFEPWHRSYKWTALAKVLHEKKMTIGEYYNLIENGECEVKRSPATRGKIENDGV